MTGVLLAFVLAGGARAATTQDRLDSGEILLSESVVPGHSQRRIHVEAVINTPPERVWAIITDCANFKSTMPSISASALLQESGEVLICESTLDLTWPLPNLNAVTRVVHTVVDGRWTAEWTLVSGDYTYDEGSWNLTPLRGDPTRTFVVYEVLVAPKVAVPESLKRFGETRALPLMIRGLRKQLGVGP